MFDENGNWISPTSNANTYAGIQSIQAPGIGNPSIMQQQPPNPYGSAPSGGQFGGEAMGILGNLAPADANGSGFGLNLPTVNAGLSAFGQLGGLYLGLKQLGLAKDSFKLQKEAYRTNLANSTRSYNTQVGDRVAGRTYRTQAERDAALAAASLPTPGY